MINREIEQAIIETAEKFPVITITGPRQSGKSTLCRKLFSSYEYVNFELPDIRKFAISDPRQFLSHLEDKRGIILDEIQRCPELPSYLQVIVDEDPRSGRWILTGSQNILLLESISQSLAGRSALFNLLPLSYDEIKRFEKYPTDIDELMITGGYPRLYDIGLRADEWIGEYVATYIERDVRNISRITNLLTFQRFLELCAGRTGQMLNLSSLASDSGISQSACRDWISVLEASFVIHRLPSFLPAIRKRVVKMPKIFFYDTGVVCWLIGIRTIEHLKHHPLRGAIFETFVAGEIIKCLFAKKIKSKMYFYRDRNGREIDFIIENGRELICIEAKSSQTITDDMIRFSVKCERIFGSSEYNNIKALVIYAGDESIAIKNTIFVPWNKIGQMEWLR